MQLCAACSRHVFHDAPACPFCGASLRASPAPATTLIGLALGVALLVDGVRDLKAARPGRSARVRVAPTFGGLVVSGRF